jgi:hypothetical protein
MNLISQTTNNAAQIDRINRETLSYVQSQLKRSYDLVFNDGDPQPVLDAMGENASTALQIYSAFYQALNTLDIADTIIAPDFSIYQPQSNGTVVYVAPITE